MKRKYGWHIIFEADGKLGWEELNKKMAFDSGVEEPYCEDEDNYKKAIREGWITFEDGKTQVWADGEYVE